MKKSKLPTRKRQVRILREQWQSRYVETMRNRVRRRRLMREIRKLFWKWDPVGSTSDQGTPLMKVIIRQAIVFMLVALSFIAWDQRSSVEITPPTGYSHSGIASQPACCEASNSQFFNDHPASFGLDTAKDTPPPAGNTQHLTAGGITGYPKSRALLSCSRYDLAAECSHTVSGEASLQ